jgi:hypothetical protein
MAKLTDDQFQLVLKYLGKKMKEDEIAMGNPTAVIRWLLENPLPNLSDVKTEVEAEDAAEKERRIALLTEELERLEGE